MKFFEISEPNKKTILTVIITAILTTLILFVWDKYNPRNLEFKNDNISVSSIKKFNDVKEILQTEYYKNLDANSLLEGAVAGMAESVGDPYTFYYTPEQTVQNIKTQREKYVGIGVMVSKNEDKYFYVYTVYKNSPAQKVGLKSGDIITEVDGKDISKIKDEQIVFGMIAGKKGTKVKIKLYRETTNKYFTVNVLRDEVKITNIESRLINDSIGYIRIIHFDSTIANDFEKILNNMKNKNITDLIIDVRGNGGGYYSQVVKIADSLLPKCTIVYTEDKNADRRYEYSDNKNIDLPIVVLTDKFSASASEILAGAIKDNNRGVLVGTKTYGKGLVQITRRLWDGSSLKISIENYFTPSGKSIDGIGIKPNVFVKLEKKYENLDIAEIPAGHDFQLEKAIEILTEK